MIVGVNEYANRNLDTLRFAEADAKDLAAVLAKSGYEVRLLLGSKTGDDAATAENVRAALDATLKGVSKADTVLVGLSGHGVHLFVGEGDERREVPFFCGRDAVPTDGATMVSLSEMLKKLDDQAAGTISCWSMPAATWSIRTRAARGSTARGSRIWGVNTVAFFSCGSRQRAQETDKAGGGHGVFFHYVLEGLRGKAATPRQGDV